MASCTPLERLLVDGRAEASPVAVQKGAVLDWTDFAGHVGALRDVLASAPGRWALFTTDAYAFAVGLMAIWQADSVAAVVPNAQPGTLAALAPTIRGLVTDAVEASGVRTEPALRAPAGGWTPRLLDRASARLELSTSGTTGDRRTVVKTVAQLGDEVQGLERRWGAEVAERQVLATVSQQHIYGLLFRILWPLCAGRVFRAEPLLFPEEMRAALAGGPGGCLVTTPAHLRRLKDMRAASGLAAVCRPIFSSGSPLDAASAARLAETVGTAPFEVFGSTETGGVAWRQQRGDATSAAWQPFDGVRVSASAVGLLHVQSPYVGQAGGFTLADRAELRADGRFVLAGRSDRVVKVGGKRLSLPDMEERLLGHAEVSQAALVEIPARGEARVGCAIVLTPAGRERLAAGGRRPLTAELLAHLAPYWDRVLLPRLWRFVDRLPEDEQGKLAGAALAQLFEAAPEDAPVAPEVLAESTTATTCRRRLRVPEALLWCEGHFPELAVVPGFVQIGWVMDAARALAGGRASLEGLEALKFRELLRPGDVVELHVERAPAGLSYRLVREDGRVVSSGRCRLAECGA